MDLPLLSALFIAFAMTLYVLLDGFDLGVGALLLFQPDETLRDRMVDSITPTWDGNETWLIMAGVGLLAGFPIAYGILLPAFYIPLIAMLLSLGLRGVSFEFRYQVDRGRRIWDVAFGIGSILAALFQGLIVGALIQGVAVTGEHFSGSVFDVFRPFCALTAVAVLSGYVVLGAGWLHLKASAKLQHFAETSLSVGTPIFAGLAVVTCIAGILVQPRVQAAWAAYPVVLGMITSVFFVVVAVLLRSVGREPAIRPFLQGLILFACGVAGLAIVIFPYIVPFQLSLWEAASATLSHVFMLAGAVVVTPIVLAYSAFAYHVFRGKTPEEGWES
ncbi:cytochrome d ubiquinol oxidase subunit II [Bradyrhizobium genosp. P]|uniref:cytochrome d ubiquinol oxidase subunit II n=1 Tax=Bradyrhizobium genosp. P TaxID=83641 RepID=UPI003CEB6F84